MALGSESTLNTVRCRYQPGAREPLLLQRWDASRESILASAADGPLAYVVSDQRLGIFKGAQDVLVHRRPKHPAKSMSTLLLGRERPVAIDGAYTAAGQVARSIRTLLANAVELRERNAYIIGVSDKLFARINASALDGAHSTRPSASSLASEEGALRPADYLRLLEEVEIPPQLTKTLIGESDEMQLARRWIALAARSPEPVLILGETGTGKEVAAYNIHLLDPVHGPHRFQVINCGAVPAELIESELFGYERGAFTGALPQGKRGHFVAAGDGTLFLDEIGDLALRDQVKILRVLQSGTFSKVGGTSEEKARCRIVAATNRNLYDMVQTGQFREDLYYRLRQLVVRMPRLCEHPGDIPLLARHFWRQISDSRRASGLEVPPLSEAVLQSLASCRWPGNGRELRAVLGSLATICGRRPATVEHLRAVFQIDSQVSGDPVTFARADEARIHRVECLRHLRRTDEVIRACKVQLEPCLGRRLVMDDIGTARVTLGRRLAELRILTAQPGLFCSPATFQAVHRLMGELTRIQNLLADDPTAAQRLWKKELSAELIDALVAIMREVEWLLKKL